MLEQMDDQTFSYRLRALRERNGWSRYKLAKKANVSPDTIKYWEIGLNQPNIGRAKQLTKIFGVTLDYLCGDGDEI